MDNGKPFQQSNNNSPSFAHDPKNTDPFVIDDLFDLSSDGNMVAADGGGFTAETAGDASTTAADNVDFCNLAPEPNYAGSFMDSDELCIPYADAAELEWISSITEDSFSNEEFEQLQLIQGLKSSSSSSSSSLTSLSHSAQPGTFQQYYHFQPEPARTSNPALRPEVSVPGKARTKRSRVAPENWASRLRAVSKDDVFVPSAASSTSPEPEVLIAARKPASKPKKIPENSEGRKCLHCSTDRTPQWRTGPMGPKTLCNACGVRYKSGRLVPEYRPAASPTFALSKHSNSHRKVMELRRQNEMLRAQEQDQFMQHQQHHHQNMVFDHDHHHRLHHHNHHHYHGSSNNGENYMIHPHMIGAASYSRII